MNFVEFAQQVEKAGLIPKDCGNNHWQIRGGKYCVNYYPAAGDGPTFYVNATNTGVRKRITVADAITAANNPLHKRSIRKTKRKRGRFYSAIKKRLLGIDPHCYWCRKPLEPSTATSDHMIPLSMGGTNGTDNQVLACYDCNRNRRNDLPIRTEWEKMSK